METLREFYGRRVAEEREAAAVATCAVARERHKQLANLYVEKLEGAKPRGRASPVVMAANDVTTMSPVQ